MSAPWTLVTSAIGELDVAGSEAAVARLTASLTAKGLRAGEVATLCGEQSADWVVALLALQRVGVAVLPISADAPGPETERLHRIAEASWQVTVDASGNLMVAGSGAGGDRPPGAILLPTSGSTTIPRLVVRPPESWIAEAHRYADGDWARANDRILLAAPLAHAYALGWLYGALLAGASVRAVPATALGAIIAELRAGASVMVTVPGQARVLARRPAITAAGPFPSLRLVMAGAGYVDEALDASVLGALGVALARNYGSTETGAVLAGPAGLPAGCVGGPMPGVEITLVPYPDRGELQVRLEDGTVQRMGDLAVLDASGLYTILRRRSGDAIRRGARWVSPYEVEAVLTAAPGVVDASVRAVPGGSSDLDEERLVAEVVLAGPSLATPDSLAAWTREHLSAYKVPERFVPMRRISRGVVGKRLANARYRLGAAGTLTAAAQAYKVSELLFALVKLGGWELLADGVDAQRFADVLGLDPTAARDLLEIAARAGLLDVDAGGVDAASLDVGVIVALEEAISREWVTRENLAEVARSGPGAPIRRRQGFDDNFRARYREALRGPAAARRARVGLRLAQATPHDRLLEVSVAGVQFITTAAELGQVAQAYSYLAPDVTGPWSGTEPEPRAWDICLVSNAIHGPDPANDLGWLADRLAAGGRLLIDDVFDDDENGHTLPLDWLTHGGQSWWRRSDLRAGLDAVGLQVVREVNVGHPPVTVMLARRAEECPP